MLWFVYDTVQYGIGTTYRCCVGVTRVLNYPSPQTAKSLVLSYVRSYQNNKLFFRGDLLYLVFFKQQRPLLSAPCTSSFPFPHTSFNPLYLFVLYLMYYNSVSPPSVVLISLLTCSCKRLLYR